MMEGWHFIYCLWDARGGLSEKVAFEQRSKKKVGVGFPGVPVVRMLRSSLQGDAGSIPGLGNMIPACPVVWPKKKKGVGAVVISYPPSGDWVLQADGWASANILRKTKLVLLEEEQGV